MPTTYTLISSNVLTSSAASVTFLSIPATYTDLVVRWSVRGDSATNYFNFNLNGETGSTTTYSRIALRGDGSAVSNDLQANDGNEIVFGSRNLSTYTASTFSNGEIYIPSYTASQNKPFGISTVVENNATAATYINTQAGLWRNTSAINQIVFTGTNFVSGSSFYLYGISNA